jgi:hypothetical protein
MKFLFLSLLFLFSGMVYGQQAADTVNTIVVHKDPRVDVLVKKQAGVNAAIKKANARTARGYRLLVVNTNKRDEATAAKTKVYTHFPELKADLVYQTPYFKLKAGNFRTREEAQDYQKLLSIYFPKGVMIVSDVIEVTPEKDSE